MLKLESSLKSANIALKMKDYELKKNGERLRFSSQGKTSAEKKTGSPGENPRIKKCKFKAR